MIRDLWRVMWPRWSDLEKLDPLAFQLALEGVLRAIDHAHAVSPILDPTLYRAKVGSMAEDRELVAAALALVNVGKAKG